MCILPLDICSEIFLRSPAESLIRFRAVCKVWRAAIDDPCFVKIHTEQQQQLPSTTILFRIRNSTRRHPAHPLYSLNLRTLEFTDSRQSLSATPLDISRDGLCRLPQYLAATCNGLMLIPPPSRAAESNWEIWNILTHERLQLPLLDSSIVRWSANGLGYDAATDDYKAVVIGRQDSKKPPVYHTYVYSLRSDEWRKIANFPCYDLYIACSVGAFLGGALHWITFKGIVALDLKTESYRHLDMPPLRERKGTHYEDISNRDLCIHELSGCLMLSDAGTHDGEEKHFDLWEMKENGTWMNLIALTRSHCSASEYYMRPVAYMKNKMQVFLQDSSLLYLFDVESKSRKTVCVHGLSRFIFTQAFQGTIFRLLDNCGRVNGGPSFPRKTSCMIRMTKDFDTELIFCLRDDAFYRHFGECFSHYGCFSLDSNCCYSSKEEEEVEEEEEEKEE